MRRFFFVPQSLKPVALPLDISAKHFPNAILNPHPAQKSFRLGAYVLGAATTGTLISTWAERQGGEKKKKKKQKKKQKKQQQQKKRQIEWSVQPCGFRTFGLSRRINSSPIPPQLEPEIVHDHDPLTYSKPQVAERRRG